MQIIENYPDSTAAKILMGSAQALLEGTDAYASARGYYTYIYQPGRAGWQTVAVIGPEISDDEPNPKPIVQEIYANWQAPAQTASGSFDFNYGIITDIAWQNSWGLANEYILANLMGMDGQALSNVTIGNKWGNAGFGSGTFNPAEMEKATVGYNKLGNTDFYGHLFQFTVNAAGQYVATAVGSDAIVNSIVNSNPYITCNNGANRLIANDNTVYLVKTGNAATGYTYTTYTGYRNVPSINNATACFVLNSTGVSP